MGESEEMNLDELAREFQDLKVGGETMLLSEINRRVEADDMRVFRRSIFIWKFTFFSVNTPLKTLVIEGTEEAVMATLEKLKS